MRLVSSPLGAAEDFALEFLGLQLATVDEQLRAVADRHWASRDPRLCQIGA
jgi:hypothetical protein